VSRLDHEAALDALPLGCWLEVVTNVETFHLQRVEGGWHLPGDLTIASGDVLDGQPERAETLFGDDPYDERDHVERWGP